jgi:uncharacterized membrane protein YgcG
MSKSVRTLVLGLFLGALLTAPAQAQTTTTDGPANCGAYEGIVCHGWFSDNADIASQDDAIAEAIGAVVQHYGNQIAFVTVPESPHGTPLEFARDLGDAWGVGDATRQDGIVILVDIANRRTEMAAGPGVPALDYSRVTGAATSFFSRDDFDNGIFAIIGSLEQELAGISGEAPSGGEAPSSGVTPPSGTDRSGDGGAPAGLVLGALAAAALAGGGIGLAAARHRRRERVTRERAELIDGDVARLEPAGQELPLLADYSIAPPANRPDINTRSALAALERIAAGLDPQDETAVRALWGDELVALIDRERLKAQTEIPLDLRISGEQPLLEGALQAAYRDALDVEADADEAFGVKRQDLLRIIESLRPHRIANTRFKMGQAILDRTVSTPAGWALINDSGERFLQAGPVLDTTAPLHKSIEQLDFVYATAQQKAQRMETLYQQLPSSTTRPAVAAALADLTSDPDAAYQQYEALRQTLETKGSILNRDGLSIPAITALLLMNNDAEDVDEFLVAYEANRKSGITADTAIEYALAGLTHPGEIKRMRAEADRLSLPISLTAALLRRRDDGPEVYQKLADQLASSGVKGDNRRTIAAVLAISLEPAQAIRRWTEARQALAALGLIGAYADVAAAFGASDPRGPQTFALAYAAQRQALSRSTIDDADRFAPELAHEGTGHQTDSWSGQPIPRGLSNFDPFTLLFYHWVITKGSRGAYGWEPVYRDNSWSHDSGSWWGGGGGFHSGGSRGGGSSWGGGSWSSGSFGGFGGGGGFSGGGGGGSGW